MNKWLSKILALLLLLLVMSIGFFLLVGPASSYYDSLQVEKRQLEHRLSYFRQIVEHKDEMIDKIDKAKNSRNDIQIYLTSVKPALAAAELQSLIKKRMKKAGAELLSSQSVSIDEDADRQIGVAVHCKTDIFGLQRLLHSIEYSAPLLLLSQLDVGRGSQTIYRVSNKNNKSQNLDVKFTVYGFLAKQETLKQ